MKTPLTLICLSLIVPCLYAQAHGCTDPGTQWIINPVYIDGTTINAIQGDGAPYVNGQSGVTALIQICSGTTDATLLLSKSRSVSFSFAKLLASNSNTPSWALSGSTVTGGFLNVRDIFFVPAGSDRNQEYTFTTWLGSNTSNANLRIAGPSPEAPQAGAGPVNTPYPNSLIVVHHCPANTNTSTCPNIVHETWFAYPDPNPTASGVGQTGLPITQVGTLLVGNKLVNGGEFSMPFLFTISLLN